MATSSNAKKCWCFTVNNPNERDVFLFEGLPGTLPSFDSTIQYLIYQVERGDQEGTRHFQGFLILKTRKRLNWLKQNINQRAHWEPMRGSPKQARDYCRKEDTRESGPFEFGSWPYKESEEGKKMSEIREEAYQECDQLKLGYKRPQDIQASILMCPGFIPAMKELCADILGPYRPDLRVITMIGPPGVGKSYAIQQFFPDHGRCIYANNGVWFQNPCEKVMIFEEEEKLV